MVAVIVHDCNAAGDAALLEAPVDAAEAAQALGNLAGGYIELARDGHGGRGIEDVVTAGDVQFKWAEHFFGGVHLESRIAATVWSARSGVEHGVHHFHAKIGFGRDAIGKDSAARAGKDGAELRIVDAGRYRAVERHAVHEFEEGAFHIFHVAVAVHVFAVEVGDDGADGRELEERAVALVGFSNQEMRAAEARIGA